MRRGKPGATRPAGLWTYGRCAWRRTGGVRGQRASARLRCPPTPPSPTCPQPSITIEIEDNRGPTTTKAPVTFLREATRPRTISFARSARHALTRRCNVLSCALLAYASGTSVARRSINVLAETAGSAISHPSTTGHASANGSTRVFHQCLALGCLRCVGRTSPSFHADARLATKSAMAGVPATTSSLTPWAARSLSVC